MVTDSSGALVPGATIVVTNLDNGARRETATNESGVYQFPLLQPGLRRVMRDVLVGGHGKLLSLARLPRGSRLSR